MAIALLLALAPPCQTAVLLSSWGVHDPCELLQAFKDIAVLHPWQGLGYKTGKELPASKPGAKRQYRLAY
jgi:hypothetical protein